MNGFMFKLRLLITMIVILGIDWVWPKGFTSSGLSANDVNWQVISSGGSIEGSSANYGLNRAILRMLA